jgi:hypothetical protein
VRHHDEVHDEVEVQDEHVPGQDRLREVQVPDAREQVPEAVGAADVHEDEQQAHHDRADGQQFPVDDDLANRLPVVDVRRDHQDDGRRRDADEEREVADVEAPADLVAHRGDDQARPDLDRIGQAPRRDQDPQEGHPGPIHGVAPQDQAEAPGDELREEADGAHGDLTSRRSRRISGRC